MSAFSTEGTVQWSKSLPGGLSGVGGDGSLYFVNYEDDGFEITSLALRKYSVNGVLLWSRDVTPSVPYDKNIMTGTSAQIEVRGENLYVLTDFYRNLGSRDLVGNTEVRRYTADGTEMWSRFLYPAETGSAAVGFSTFPIGVTVEGEMYLLAKSSVFADEVRSDTHYLHRFSAAGEHTDTALETYTDDVETAALLPLRVTNTFGNSETAFYTVGTKRKINCVNFIDTSRPCVNTDAVTSLYTVDGASDKTALYSHLQWISR